MLSAAKHPYQDSPHAATRIPRSNRNDSSGIWDLAVETQLATSPILTSLSCWAQRSIPTVNLSCALTKPCGTIWPCGA